MCVCVSFYFMHASISTKVTDEDAIVVTAATTGGSGLALHRPAECSGEVFFSTASCPSFKSPRHGSSSWTPPPSKHLLMSSEISHSNVGRSDSGWKPSAPPLLLFPPLLSVLSTSSASPPTMAAFVFQVQKEDKGCGCRAACALVGKGVSGVRRGRIQE